MIVAVDASVAVKSFLPEPHNDVAERLLASSHELVAPELIRLEVANALLKAVRRRAIELAEMQEALVRFSILPIRMEPIAAYADEAPIIAARFGGSVYDALYVLVAQMVDAMMATSDAELARTARLASVRVWLLSEPPPAELRL